jgi:hypothetical protein
MISMMLASRVVLALFLGACGKWTFVETKAVPLKPTLGPIEASSRQLIATTAIESDGKVAIDARIELGKCTRSSTVRVQDTRVERYVIPGPRGGTRHYPLLITGGSTLGLGAIFYGVAKLIGANTDEATRPESTTTLIQAYEGVGIGAAIVGAPLLFFGIRESARKNSTRNTAKGTREEAPTRITATCPTPGKLEHIDVVTPWGEQLSTSLKGGKGVLAIDWVSLVRREEAESSKSETFSAGAALDGTWKLTGGKPPLDFGWKPTGGELVGLRRVYAAERDKIAAGEREKTRLANVEKRKQTGPPSFAVVSAISEFEVVPAGLPTRIRLHVRNPGPGPADDARLTVTVPGGRDASVSLGPLAVNAAVDRELIITFPANHPAPRGPSP